MFPRAVFLFDDRLTILFFTPIGRIANQGNHGLVRPFDILGIGSLLQSFLNKPISYIPREVVSSDSFKCFENDGRPLWVDLVIEGAFSWFVVCGRLRSDPTVSGSQHSNSGSQAPKPFKLSLDAL